jgi:transcriptional regulator with XRE-family HTH domain
MKFSEEIRRCRERLGMTQLDFANLLGRSMQTISNWECGRGDPWPSVQARVLNQLRHFDKRSGKEDDLAQRRVTGWKSMGPVFPRRWRGPVDLGPLD